jgi:haloalkane dehalogenase
MSTCQRSFYGLAHLGDDASRLAGGLRSLRRMRPSLRLADEVVAAYDAPFPDQAHKAGVDAFPTLVPLTAYHPMPPFTQATREKLLRSQLRRLFLFSNRNPITMAQRSYSTALNNAVQNISISDAGHFLQEDKGEELAENTLSFFH